ncbi:MULTISPECIES: hypothetical protein [unclassified Avibacterium]|uniref:hypothetical protein n=1 Tax=unclassified Avibacterium TaxID=2685287 RepID=UPI00202661DE|nr:MULTISPECIES: hypothetical protein [unclassified Avibacterium]MCW9718731.1 hypothetical protein [Avibacterium sp. 21-599]MCW9732938.1 hypothetical protein [Avibacterium sp. 20-15]URL05073.1 hypothetical protein L4F93_04165 [Avibacterium sp. 20-132]URL06635.1 hypothetical protein L4F92_00460 [Avibacterium sp. 21-595]
MSLISKTFGGLNKAYYFRHLFFGVVIFILLELLIFNAGKGIIDHKFILSTLMFLIFTLLYPYSRFVYESIVGYIFGENVFIVNAILLLITKMVTMLICFMFSWIIAPIGLVFLYFYHTKQEKQTEQE